MGEGPEERGMATKGNIGEGKEKGNGTCIFSFQSRQTKKFYPQPSPPTHLMLSGTRILFEREMSNFF